MSHEVGQLVKYYSTIVILKHFIIILGKAQTSEANWNFTTYKRYGSY